MENALVKEIVYAHLEKYPNEIDRFENGLANFVYKVRVDNEIFVVRINGNDEESNSTYWIDKLSSLHIKIPEIKFKGKINDKKYLIMNYIEGSDLGDVYPTLNDYDKKNIAKEIAGIQKKVAKLPYGKGYGCVSSYDDESFKKTWLDVILSDLDRSREWMRGKSIFDISKIDEVEKLLKNYTEYFNKIKPIPFLDDITTKNVRINERKLSGIVDFDWICFGDFIYFIALTNMSLINMGADTKYVDYLVENFELGELQKEILEIYTLVFCVIFMSETGMTFNKSKPIKLDKENVSRLNCCYKELILKIHRNISNNNLEVYYE